jgi:transcriptional regulator with XRE-family HTH domain
MFWDRYSDLCAKKGESPNAVAKNLKIASGTVTEWKNGREPRNSTALKIASYFGVSVDYIIGKSNDPSPERKKPVEISDELWNALQNNPDVLSVCEEIARNPEMLQVFKAINARRDGV